MESTVEFNRFYKLLSQARDGDKKSEKELDWLLAEYEHAKDSKSAYDEIGQIFCHIGVMELYNYTAIEDIEAINSLEKPVWKYLEVRTGERLGQYLERKMESHSKEHDLASKISVKWDFPIEEMNLNISGLAQYVTEGILDIIK